MIVKLNGLNNDQIRQYKDVQDQQKLTQNEQKNVQKEEEQQKKNDKLELSDAAKKLQTSGLDTKKMSDIKAKIDNGFYNSNEVVEKVAGAILKEINGQ